MTLTAEEMRYKKTVNRLAYTMLIFYALFTVISLIIQGTDLLTADMRNRMAANVIYELVYAVCYVIAFVVPVFFFRLISKGERSCPMFTALYLPRETPLYIFAGMSLILPVAYINSMLLEPIFGYSELLDEMMGNNEVVQNYELVLMFLVMAVIPGFVEEFLFRGLVLTNLLPYGRTAAVVASALLFGIMHQNAGQLLYATAAGLVLGYIYVYTKSIWPCVLLHFCNNFFSVLQTALLARLPEATASLWLYGIQGVVLILGVFSAVVLIFRGKDRKKPLRLTGCFEREVEPDAEYAQIALPAGRRVRLFFTAPMIVYICLCGAQMILLLVMALVM